MVKTKDKTFWGVFGVILLIFGITGTISLAINKYFIGLPITAVLVIVGVLLMSWAFSG